MKKYIIYEIKSSLEEINRLYTSEEGNSEMNQTQKILSRIMHSETLQNVKYIKKVKKNGD